MADSPAINSTGVVDISIKVAGTECKSTGLVRCIEVEQNVNRICRASITLEDGNMPANESKISDGDDFEPGKQIEILVSYNNQAKTSIFKGVVVRHGMKIDADGQLLVIECFDNALAMTIGRKNANYTDVKNSDLVSLIAANYLSVEPGQIQSSSVTYVELVQFNTSDWDFIVARAEACGLVVINKENSISLQDPTVTSTVLDITYGQDIINIEANISAIGFSPSVTATAWDLASQKAITESATTKKVTDNNNLSANQLAEVLDIESIRLQSSTNLTKEALKEWSNAQQIKSALSKTIGTVQFQGSSKVSIGNSINLIGLGKRFNDDVFVSGVNHVIENGDWLTTVSFGLAPSWFTESHQVEAPLASGLLPGVAGLMVGKVIKLDGDPLNEQRIQVSVPVLENQKPGLWARIIQPYASSGFGLFTMPEIDDEVVLGYFNSDPSNPVILGSLYSSKNPPPTPLESDNNIKTLVTRCGHKFEFDEDKKVITLSTSSGNQMVMSDDEKSITLKDVNNNKVTLDEQGISLVSPKNINLEASGNIDLKATGNVAISASADSTINAMNVSAEAQVGLTAKGNATAELSASGQTTVKGALVMIN